VSAGRLVDRGARPAVRRRTTGLVEIALPPAPAALPSSPPDESPPIPVRRSDEAPPLPRRPAKVKQPLEPSSPRPSVRGRTPLPATPAPPPHGDRLPLRRPPRESVEEAAPSLGPPSASTAGGSFDTRAAPVPEESIEASLVPPVDLVSAEQPAAVVSAAEPVTVVAAAAVQAPPPSSRPDARNPVARASTSTPVPVSPSPPSVVIERIEVVTPAARPLPVDPLASMAERRAGRSRHGAAR
jgi:hypothetical protein